MILFIFFLMYLCSLIIVDIIIRTVRNYNSDKKVKL